VPASPSQLVSSICLNPLATRLALAFLLLCGAGLPSARGADPMEDDILWIRDDDSSWFVRAGPRALFNVRADIRQKQAPIQPGRYDNGFVLPDISGPTSAQTWNWGYQDPSQVSGNLLYQSRLRNTAQAGEWDGETDTALGGEFAIGSELFRFDVGERVLRGGLEAGYAFNQFTVQERSQTSGTATQQNDGFNTGGIALPTAPYSGSFDGPGPLIDRTPSVTSSITSPSQATFDGEMESNLHTLKMGFWVDYDLTERLLLSGSLGYASIYADTDLSYTESYSFTDPRIPDTGPEARDIGSRDWRPGIYAEVRMEYPFSERVFSYLGAQYQWNKDQEFSDEGREVTLDFGAQFAVSGGLGFRF